MLPSKLSIFALSIAVLSGGTITAEPNEGVALPDGWIEKSPRDEIRPTFLFEPQGGPTKAGSLIIRHDQRDGLDGWFQKSFVVTGGEYVRFQAARRVTNVAVPRRSALVRVVWRNAAGALVPADISAEQFKELGHVPTAEPEHPTDGATDAAGWTTVHGVYRVPTGATHADVELHLQWAPNGQVDWSNVELSTTSQPPTRKVRLAAIHHKPNGRSPRANCEEFAPLIANAAQQDADLVVLGETVPSVGVAAAAHETAEPIPGPTTDYFGRLAKTLQLHIALSLYERDKHLVYNSAVLLGPDGALIGKYRKVCLPHAEVEQGIAPGHDYPVFETNFGKVGLMVCYDGFFPEVARELANRGAEVIAWPVWGCNPQLAKARACENHLFIVSSTYMQPSDGWMLSAVYDQTGTPIAQAESWDSVALAEVDLSQPYVGPYNLGDFRSMIARHRPVARAELNVPVSPSSSQNPAARAVDTPDARATIRVAASQAKRRSVNWRLKTTADVLEAVDKNLLELERIVHHAGDAKCDILTLPEDTLGLLDWIGVNEDLAREVLPEAVRRMLERLGRAAASHDMYLVVCSDLVEADGKTYNTAFFLGRDGQELGRYHKVCPTWGESGMRARGTAFPVFPTHDLGTVGMLICYDLVFPETARCLSLAGADMIFFPTMGGAAIGDDDIGREALRVRAAENHVYLVVAHRDRGAMIISPRGKILAEAEGDDGLAVADIDPHGGREGGDSANFQADMRARLFRERNPDAFRILTDLDPPVLDKVPIDISAKEAGRVFGRMLTIGEEAFDHAEALVRAGQSDEAITALKQLRTDYPGTWIDRAAKKQLVVLNANVDPVVSAARIVFSEDFEQGGIEDLKQRWETVSQEETMSFSQEVPERSGGKRSLLMTHVGGIGTGGQLYRRLEPGHNKLHARFYVKFDPDSAPLHHFGTNIGGYFPATAWPQGGAGQRPRGDQAFTVGIEPFGKSWQWDYYVYWNEMRGSPPRGQTWGNSFLGETKPNVERGKWTCVEVMVKMNDVGESNGELALWIDGQPISHLGKNFPKGKWVYDKFLPNNGGAAIRWNDNQGQPENFQVPADGLPFEGFRWRTTDKLNLNYLWVYLYLTQAPQGHVSRVWFDDIVVATDYIGPLNNPAGESR